MINSANIPEARLHKRHNILSFHFVRNIIAAQYINLQYLKSQFNIIDILSKHWSYQGVYDNIPKWVFYLFDDNSFFVNYYTKIIDYDNNELAIDGEL